VGTHDQPLQPTTRNVGLYTLGKSKDSRRCLTEYISGKSFRVLSDPLETFAGHQFPYGGYRVSVPDAPVYLVGDAGGFGDSLTGEGIYHALESGRIAGETAQDYLAGRARPGTYYRRLKKSVLADTFLTYQAARMFYRSLDGAAALVSNPLIRRPMIQAYADGMTIAETLKRRGIPPCDFRAFRASVASRPTAENSDLAETFLSSVRL
jgi:flavin-dependent dehydrogenase